MEIPQYLGSNIGEAPEPAPVEEIIEGA